MMLIIIIIIVITIIQIITIIIMMMMMIIIMIIIIIIIIILITVVPPVAQASPAGSPAASPRGERPPGPAPPASWRPELAKSARVADGMSDFVRIHTPTLHQTPHTFVQMKHIRRVGLRSAALFGTRPARRRRVGAERCPKKLARRAASSLGRGDDTVGNPPRAQISQFELFELILFLKLGKQFPVEQFEATASQSAVPSPPLSHATASVSAREPAPPVERAGERQRTFGRS